VCDVIVNETDLAVALRAGKIGGTRIDALTNKPPDDDHPLHADNLPNLLVSPHSAWGPIEPRQHLANEIATLIRDYKSGAPRNSSLPA
jgi:glycerate dehydrogenase